MATVLRFLPGALFLASVFCTTALAQSNSPDMRVVERWLATNTGVETLRVDFTQTRTMKSIRVPVRQEGTLWLDYQNRQFRWQLGDPPQTIVVSLGQKVLIIRTPMKRYEVRQSGSGGTPGMAAMAKGFPRTLREFQQRYRVLETTPEANTRRIVTRPLGEAGRGVETFTFVVDASHHRLLGIEINLEDGSSLDTVFRQVEPNPALPKGLFQPSVEGYTETKF